VGVAVVGSMPSVGLYFGVYSFCKKSLSEWGPPTPKSSSSSLSKQRNTKSSKSDDEAETTTKPKPYLNRVLVIALSAAIGNSVASASRVPYEVLKQKLQTNVYATLGEALQDVTWKNIFPTGGIASQMLRDIPYAVVTLLAYEYLQSSWKNRLSEQSHPRVPARAWDMVLGGLAGGLGSYLTNPMDVVKTRLQTSSDLYGGSIRTCVIQTWSEGGPNAFLRGSVPRLLHKVPANGFFFLFYEVFRSILQVNEEE
jgi:hypothetical protein